MFPSVTTVLAPFSGIADLQRRFPGVIERAAQRGTVVHGYCESSAKGFPPVGIPEELRGYWESFMCWFADVQEVIACELRLFDIKLGFHGQADIICRMKGDTALSLWDYKTPEVVSPTWGPQIAAYFHLAESSGYQVKRAGMIRLRKSGRPPIITEYTETRRRNWNVFVSALNVYTAFFAGKRKKGTNK
jgi:hypothetical protein